MKNWKKRANWVLLSNNLSRISAPKSEYVPNEVVDKELLKMLRSLREVFFNGCRKEYVRWITLNYCLGKAVIFDVFHK